MRPVPSPRARPRLQGLKKRKCRAATISKPSNTSHSRSSRSDKTRRMPGGKPLRLQRARMPHRLQGRKPSTSSCPSPTSTRSTSRSTAYGSGANSSVCGSSAASTQSLVTGIWEGRAMISAPVGKPAAAIRLCRRVRLPASSSRPLPQAPTCSNSQPNTSSSASPSSSDSAASSARPMAVSHQAESAASRSRMREVRTGTTERVAIV